ncbi:MAG: IS256 family transposase, partial [Veillonella caviae]|nr:IS256 family transposase [Veillonella caviae]
LLKAENSLNILVHNGNLFTYLNDAFDFKCPSTNNRIEGGVNAQLRAVLRNHRGMTIEKRTKAVFWWCYMHSPNPLSLKEILEVMPTNKSISTIYNTMNERSKLEASISTWGDAIV